MGGDIYIENEIYNTDGSIKDQVLYDEKMIEFENNPTYNNLVKVMTSQKNMTSMEKATTDLVENSYNNNLFFTPEGQKNLQNALPDGFEELSDQGKKLVAQHTILKNEALKEGKTVLQFLEDIKKEALEKQKIK